MTDHLQEKTQGSEFGNKQNLGFPGCQQLTVLPV